MKPSTSVFRTSSHICFLLKCCLMFYVLNLTGRGKGGCSPMSVIKKAVIFHMDLVTDCRGLSVMMTRNTFAPACCFYSSISYTLRLTLRGVGVRFAIEDAASCSSKSNRLTSSVGTLGLIMIVRWATFAAVCFIYAWMCLLLIRVDRM